MIKRLFILMMLALMALIFAQLAANYTENTSLLKLGRYYVEEGPRELGAPTWSPLSSSPIVAWIRWVK